MSDMTATRTGVLRLATLAVAAAGWIAVAAWLWTSSRVPGGLPLAGLDEHRFFPARLLDRAVDYERLLHVLWIAETVVTVAAFALYAWRGARFARESAAGPIGTGMLLAMLGFGLVWLVSVPFTIVDQWWQRRHGVSKAGYLEVVFGGWAALAAEFVFLSFSVLVVMGLARLTPRHWWIPAAAVFVCLGALFTYVSPYLVSDTHRLRDPKLAAAAKRIAVAEGVGSIPIRVQNVDNQTEEVNAFATGLGNSRRVFLWNTLLDGRFGDGEIEFVIAHEYGHQARNHLPKGIAWYALFAFPGTYLIAVAARRRGGIGNPASIPLALFVLVVLDLAALPLQNLVSRHLEAEADWVALETTRDPADGQRLFQGFGRTSLAEPDPPTWAYLLLDSHPTLMQRIAMTRAWRDRHRGATPAAPPAGS
jgi:STE24 endopeptidase